nr:MAG TPA: head tail joining protein [Caudoviricetes sp.]
MQIGKLNHRIKILRPILTSDGYGGYITNYEKATALWAEVKDSRYSEKQAFDTPNAINNVTLKTRTYTHMEKGWHIMWQGKEYEIVSVTRFYKDSTYIEIAEYEKGV